MFYKVEERPNVQIMLFHFSIASLLPLQIVGDIKAARDAVLEVTSRLRSYMYRDLLQRDAVPPSTPLPGVEASSSYSMAPVTETATTNRNVQSGTVALSVKVFFCHGYLQHYPSLFMLSDWHLGLGS